LLGDLSAPEVLVALAAAAILVDTVRAFVRVSHQTPPKLKPFEAQLSTPPKVLYLGCGGAAAQLSTPPKVLYLGCGGAAAQPTPTARAAPPRAPRAPRRVREAVEATALGVRMPVIHTVHAANLDADDAREAARAPRSPVGGAAPPRSTNGFARFESAAGCAAADSGQRAALGTLSPQRHAVRLHDSPANARRLAVGSY
jgi:hypothetical protein